MAKSLFISEKPSVAQEFAKALKKNFRKHDGYMESEDTIITWCIGHLVTMSYPESYDIQLKRWKLETLPFLPKKFKYEVIPAVSKQYNTVKQLLNREDVAKIYVCTDSGREGEYIYRLVDEMAKVSDKKEKRRVWIDSQTEEEILRGIQNAKELKEYDNLSDAAYLRAMEDYLMGINFSRVLTLKYGNTLNSFLKNEKHIVISVGRVMTCVLGMVVRREREIRSFVKMPFYRVIIGLNANEQSFEGEFRAVDGSKYFESPRLYKENGFREKEDAKSMITLLSKQELKYESSIENGKNTEKGKVSGLSAEIIQLEKKKENKYAPLLYNLAELQNDCSRMFKISPDQTLKAVQELYEKKMVTYPRTDARVLSTAVSKEIKKNIEGLINFSNLGKFAKNVVELGTYQTVAKTRYVNDKQITDHYAIIPTGQGLGNLNGLSSISKKIYELIVRRFLSIFFPPAVYQKIGITAKIETECFFSSFKVLMEEGYLKVAGSGKMTEEKGMRDKEERAEAEKKETERDDAESFGLDFFEAMSRLKKGMLLPVSYFTLKEGESVPPKRYNSGSMILAMENAGQLIEDEDLRAQIKGSGIGTSATRAEILNKLVKIEYLNLNKKTQIIMPTLLGEMIFDVVNSSIKSLLNPELTASWEKGLTYVAEGSISRKEYLEKLEGFIMRMTVGVKNMENQGMIRNYFNETGVHYK